MKTKTTTLAATFAVAAGIAGAAIGTGQDSNAAAVYDAPVDLELTFLFHIDEDLAEQDVYIEREPGSGEVYRPTKGERNLDQPLYAAASPVEHAPFEPDDLGPWRKGEALGFTLRQWFAAKGSGRYICENGAGHLDIQFEHLAPDAAYTIWHDFFAWPPTEPFIGTYDLPLGARDGSESVFRTDANGNARVVRDFKPCLQLTGEQMMAELAIALHSDGKTHGHEPGPFGSDTHVHMYVGLPKRAGI